VPRRPSGLLRNRVFLESFCFKISPLNKTRQYSRVMLCCIYMLCVVGGRWGGARVKTRYVIHTVRGRGQTNSWSSTTVLHRAWSCKVELIYERRLVTARSQTHRRTRRGRCVVRRVPNKCRLVRGRLMKIPCVRSGFSSASRDHRSPRFLRYDSVMTGSYRDKILCFNPVDKPQSNGPLAVDGWAVTFGTARRGLSGLRPRTVPFLLYQM